MQTCIRRHVRRTFTMFNNETLHLPVILHISSTYSYMLYIYIYINIISESRYFFFDKDALWIIPIHCITRIKHCIITREWYTRAKPERVVHGVDTSSDSSACGFLCRIVLLSVTSCTVEHRYGCSIGMWWLAETILEMLISCCYCYTTALQLKEEEHIYVFFLYYVFLLLQVKELWCMVI